MTEKRFLILTSDSGFGHRSAAKSVLKALEYQYPDQARAEIINPILETDTPLLLKQIETGYDRRVRTTPQLYRFTYEISDSRLVSGVIENALTLLLQRNIRELVKAFQPDAILSTNMMFNSPTRAVLHELEMEVPFFTAVTDLADVHSLWFGSGPDRFFLASEWVKVKALENGLTEDKLCVSGIPVDPDFALARREKADLRRELGLDPDLTTLLFVGSARTGNIAENLEALGRVPYPLQAVVITGGYRELYDQLSGLEWSFPCLLRDYVTNMPEWMGAADVLVSKAGGLILSEGLAAGLPVAIIDYLPGQEEGNIRYVLSHGAGTWPRNPGELSAALTFWLAQDGRSLKRAAASARELGRPRSALRIAAMLWQASQLPLLDLPKC